MSWQRWQTKGPGRRQRDLWQDVVCSSILNVDLRLPDFDAFHFNLAQMSVGGSRVCRFGSTPHALERSSAMAARGCGEHYMISTQIAGTMAVRSATTEVMLRPGDVGILDTERPFSANLIGQTARAMVLIEKKRFGSLPPLGRGSSLGILPANHPHSRIIRQYILSLGDTDYEHDDETTHALIGNLASAISHVRGTVRARPITASVTLADANAYIAQHCSSSTLTPGVIAAALGMSLRKLFSLYETSPVSVEQAIIRARLAAASEAMSSFEFRHESLTSIAMSFGFKDSAHFSRKFRELHGMSPSQWRAARLTG